MIDILLLVGFFVVLVVLWRALDSTQRAHLQLRIEELGNELRLRHIETEARRYDLRVLLSLWNRPTIVVVPRGLAGSDFERELFKQANRSGLQPDGSPRPGYPPAALPLTQRSRS